MRASGVVAILAILGLGAAVAVLATRQGGLEDRVRALEGAREEGPSGRAGVASRPTSPAALEGRRTLEEDLRSLTARIDAAEVALRDRPSEAARVPGPGGAEAALPAASSPGFEDAVRDVVVRMLQDEGIQPKVAAAAKSGEVPKKPHIDVLVKALGLDDGQTRRFKEDLRETQGRLHALLAEPVDGGPTWLERLAEVDKVPEGDPRRTRLFLDLMKAKVPGGDATFLETAVSLATEFRGRTADYLRPEQSEAFARLDVDLFGVRFD